MVTQNMLLRGAGTQAFKKKRYVVDFFLSYLISKVSCVVYSVDELVYIVLSTFATYAVNTGNLLVSYRRYPRSINIWSRKCHLQFLKSIILNPDTAKVDASA